jgi:hypothetical protein
VLGFPEAYIRWEKEMLTPEGAFANEATRKFAQLFVDRMVAFVGAVSQAQGQPAR